MIKITKDCSEFPENIRYNHVTIKEKLAQVHNKKCCYCETQYIKGEVEHFRPKSKYKWLINDCENLLWSCHDCNNIKGAKLPVVQQLAIQPDTILICDEKEQLKMINPAKSNSKEWNIVFQKNGLMSSGNELTKNTIAICKLNRENLANKRLKVYNDFRDRIDTIKLLGKKDKINQLKKLILPIANDKELDYIAFRKFIIKEWLTELMNN